jgi:hypothetical protein
VTRFITIFVVSLLLSCHGWAQESEQDRDIDFRADLREVPFREFAEAVERQTGVRFYYLDEWVKGIRITVSGDHLSLRRTLDSILLPEGVGYLLDAGGLVFLSGETGIVSRLPAYTGVTDRVQVKEETGEGGALTGAEKRYIEGRKAGMLETMQVGSGEQGNGSAGAVIYGKMSDAETGEPLVGATIYIEELKKGAATDVNGRFTLVVKPGRYTASFNCMGMESRRCYLEVLSGGDLVIPMERSLIPLTEVVIQADRYQNVRGTRMGFDRLNYRILKEVPVVMGENDLLKVVRMLPGVQNVGEGSPGFNVRGSAADQNMIYVNRIPVYNSSHLFGFFSSFSPDIVKDFSLYKSNLPAGFGGRLASFIDITTRQGNMNEFTARGGISPITGHVAAEGPIRKGRSTFVLGARSTYSDWILERLDDPDLRDSDGSFYDLSGGMTFEPGERTLVKTFGYLSRDRFSLGNTNDYAYANAGASLNVRRRFSARMTGDIAMVFGHYSFSTTDQGVAYKSYSHAYRIGHYELKSDLTRHTLGSHSLTFGGNLIYYNLDRGTVEPYGPGSLRLPVELGKENGVEGGAYLADEITLTPRLTLYAGLRYSLYLSLGPGQVMVYEEGQPLLPGNIIDTLSFGKAGVVRTYGGPEPRISINCMTGKNSSLKASYNRLRQYLFMLSNTIAISPTDQWKLCDYHIAPPYADQVSAGYYLDFPGRGLNTSVEIYHKWVHRVVEYRDGASFISTPHIETQSLQGDQRAYGAELMIRKNMGKLTGWMAYSYSRSFIRVDSPVPGMRINGGMEYPSNYDRPHSLSLVSSYRLNRRLSFSANLVYMTGRPVTYPVSIYYIDGNQYLDYSSRNKYRIPDYFRVDFSINLEGNLKERKFLHSYWMLNVYNLTGRRNAYSVYFMNEEGMVRGYRLSIFGQPIVTVSWNFKLGNYASD